MSARGRSVVVALLAALASCDGEERRAAPTPPPEPTPPTESPTAVSVEVVDEDGVLVHEGAVNFAAADPAQWAHPGYEAFMARVRAEKSLARSNPVVLTALPAVADGLVLDATAFVGRLEPAAPERFTVRARATTRLRLVVVEDWQAHVRVIDRETGSPVAGASVTSARAGPAAAATDSLGGCDVHGVGRARRVVVDARGYRREEFDVRDGSAVVRLELREGTGVVTVRVLGIGGTPVANVGVRLDGARELKTDAAGRAVFADVPRGRTEFAASASDWRAAQTAGGWTTSNARLAASVRVHADEASEIVLGVPPAGAATLDARLVAEDGAPIAGARVFLGDPEGIDRAVPADDAGRVRFLDVRAGAFAPRVLFGPRAEWFLDKVEVADGAHGEVAWTLGAETIRGRVVAGPERRGVGRVAVWFRGQRTGVATSGPDGRFELPHARRGAYRVEARNEDGEARPASVAVPSDADVVVVELLDYGRVVARFAAADRLWLRNSKIRLLPEGDAARGQALAPGGGADDLVAAKVPPGRSEIEVVWEGRTRRFPVEVRSGETSVVEIRAP